MKRICSIILAILVVAATPLCSFADENTQKAADVSTESTQQTETPTSPDDATGEIKYKLGDVDKDDAITSGDAMSILRTSLGMDSVPVDSKLGDVDEDTVITSNDAVLVLRASVGLEDGNRIGMREDEELILPTSITLNNTALSLEEGKTAVLSANIAPAEAVNKSIKWTSNNDSVATVANGSIKAISEGTAIITAETANGLKATCVVTVFHLEVLPLNITLNKTYLDLKTGDSEVLIATISPDDADNKSVSWSSSNEAVVTVANGSVKAVGEGSAVITAKTTNKLAATCTVVVTSSIIEPRSITLSKTDLTIEIDDLETIKATVTPRRRG